MTRITVFTYHIYFVRYFQGGIKTFQFFMMNRVRFPVNLPPCFILPPKNKTNYDNIINSIRLCTMYIILGDLFIYKFLLHVQKNCSISPPNPYLKVVLDTMTRTIFLEINYCIWQFVWKMWPIHQDEINTNLIIPLAHIVYVWITNWQIPITNIPSCLVQMKWNWLSPNYDIYMLNDNGI